MSFACIYEGENSQRVTCGAAAGVVGSDVEQEKEKNEKIKMRNKKKEKNQVRKILLHIKGKYIYTYNNTFIHLYA